MLLYQQKDNIDQLEIPAELEWRLHSALQKQANLSRPRKRTFTAAAAIILILLIGYQSDTLAYYGKKIAGYDQVMNGTLQQLNQLGKGQKIGKTYTFRNGTSLTLDAVMFDDNQLLAFYTQKNTQGNVDNSDILSIDSLSGIFGRYFMKSGYGNINEEKSGINMIASFDPPFFLEKKLTLHFTQPGNTESGEIVFTLDRNQAMGHSLKKNLNQTVKVDETGIRFDSITASPTTTVVKGTIQGILELAADQIKGERFMPNNLVLALIANGKELTPQGGEMGTDMKGSTFRFSMDPLPPDLKQLQIKLISFGADHEVNQEIQLQHGLPNQTTQLLGQTIEINKVDEVNGETLVTISTEKSTLLTRVYLLADDKKVELKKTTSDQDDKRPDGTIIHTRTLHFPGTGGDLRLEIQRLAYVKTYNQLVDIPVN